MNSMQIVAWLAHSISGIILGTRPLRARVYRSGHKVFPLRPSRSKFTRLDALNLTPPCKHLKLLVSSTHSRITLVACFAVSRFFGVRPGSARGLPGSQKGWNRDYQSVMTCHMSHASESESESHAPTRLLTDSLSSLSQILLGLRLLSFTHHSLILL